MVEPQPSLSVSVYDWTKLAGPCPVCKGAQFSGKPGEVFCRRCDGTGEVVR